MNPKQRFKPGDRVTVPHTDSGVWTVVEFVTFDSRTKQNVYKIALPKTNATSYVKESEMRKYHEKHASRSVRDEIAVRRREEDKNLGNYKIKHDMVGRAKRTYTNESPLKDVIRMLREQGDDDKPPQDEGGASLDAQVDKYLIDYEREAKHVQQEGKDLRQVIRRLFENRLNEEGEDVGSEQEQKSIDNIDIENFANSVVRLIENYDNLIEVRSTLFRRAKNYLAKMYDEEVISSFEEIMRDQHGIEAGKTPSEIKADEFQPPNADRAGDGSIGGAGG